MKVFLTGATGYIGGATAEALRASGHTVVGLARSAEAETTLTQRGIAVHRGDINDPASVARGAMGVDAVIHAPKPDSLERWEQFETPAVEALLEVLAGTGRTFIYTSGVLVYGSTGDVVATEKSPRNPMPIITWRPPLEERILAASQRDIRTIVIYPAHVWGHGRGIPGDLVQTLKDDGVIRYIGDGAYRRTFVHVDDLADLYVLALEKADAGSEFNGTVLPAPSYKDLYEAIARGRGRAESWAEEDARRELGDAQVDGATIDQQVSGRLATEVLGWAPKHPSVLAEADAL